MLRPLRTVNSWACANCLRASQRRELNFAAAAVSRPIVEPSTQRTHSNSRHDDEILRQILDDPSSGRKLSQSHIRSGRNTGLFQNRFLVQPEGFHAFADVSLKRCQKLVKKVLAARSLEDYRKVARDMDRLSDLLCRVIDLSDFVRAVHPDRAFQHAATVAYSKMFEYMNTLNTTTGLNDQLKRALQIPEVASSWTQEERKVAKILMSDFSRSAIDLPQDVRTRFVNVSNEIAEVGNDFVEKAAPEIEYLTFEKQRMKGMDPSMIKNAVIAGNKVHVPTMGGLAYYTLRHVEDAEVRREMYIAQRKASKGSIHRLEQLVSKRSTLAKICGYETYAHYALSDKMAQTPHAVEGFLQALVKHTKPQVQSDLDHLLDLKNSDAQQGNFQGGLNAWDRDYYARKLLIGMYSRLRSSDMLSDYFSLGTVFQGLSRVFQRLYGVRLVPGTTLTGETWHNDVRRLDVLDESDQRIAVIYCDLYSRQGKSPNPAHFTMRCSRAILPDELQEFGLEQGASTLTFDDPFDAATDGMPHHFDASTGILHQLPTIALSCDFAKPTPSTVFSKSRKPTLLSFRDVQTLFHEMGHAIHSVLGRTNFQNVAGTRCATDFAELPSILMEYFAFAPQTLGLWARHWETDKPLPYELVKERLEVDRRMQAAENEAQILLAMLDQAYHARTWDENAVINSTQIYHDIWNTHASIPEPRETAWQGFFGHLYGYGATYYSYLFDRAIASKVWQDVFASGENSIDRKAGERFKNEVLKWGGSRDGWSCIAGVLDKDWMAEGGPKAMEEVGKWGVSNAQGR